MTLKKLMDYTIGYEDFYDNIIQWPITEGESVKDMPKAE